MTAKKLKLEIDDTHSEIIEPLRPQYANHPRIVHNQRADDDYPPATIGSRSIAVFIDSTLGQVFTGFMMGGIKFIDPTLLAQDDPLTFFGVTALVGMSSLFFVTCVPLMFTQQTPGKKLMGIKVVSLTPDYELTIGQILTRETIGKFISGIVLGLGYAWAIWDKDKRTWHDRMAKTRIVSIR